MPDYNKTLIQRGVETRTDRRDALSPIFSRRRGDVNGSVDRENT